MPKNSEIEHSSVRDFSDVRQEISMMKTFRKNWSNNIMTNEALIKNASCFVYHDKSVQS